MLWDISERVEFGIVIHVEEQCRMMKMTNISKHLPEWATTKNVVERILKNHPTARDSDKVLIKRVELFCLEYGLKEPSHETVTRCRRKLNAQGLYLPSKEVYEHRQEKRKFMEQAARDDML